MLQRIAHHLRQLAEGRRGTGIVAVLFVAERQVFGEQPVARLADLGQLDSAFRPELSSAS